MNKYKSRHQSILWIKGSGKYRAWVSWNGKRYHVGYFEDVLSAEHAVAAFKEKIGVHYSPAIICGVGINDRSIPTKRNGVTIKEYSVWSAMIKRCYSVHVAEKQPTYRGCIVSDNFKNYSYFYGWCQTQVGFSKTGWQLDKDIILKGNTVYSEDYCAFVPKEINSLFTIRANDRGDFPLGVHYCTTHNLIKANCNKDGKKVDLGSFKTPEDAFMAYKTFKEDYIKEVANRYKNEIDERVYNSMMSWEVGIND